MFPLIAAVLNDLRRSMSTFALQVPQKRGSRPAMAVWPQ